MGPSLSPALTIFLVYTTCLCQNRISWIRLYTPQEQAACLSHLCILHMALNILFIETPVREMIPLYYED